MSLSLNRDGNLTVGAGSFSIPTEAEDHKRPELPLLSFDSISTSTANFSRANLLGEGGFGPVYKVSIVHQLFKYMKVLLGICIIVCSEN